MISQNLKEMNLPSNHQKDTQSSVYVADMVFSVSDVKAATLSQAATLCQIRMKVDMVKEPAEPQEIKGELVSAMGELKDVLQGTRRYRAETRTTMCTSKSVYPSLPTPW